MEEDGRDQEPNVSLEGWMLVLGTEMTCPDHPRTKKPEELVRERESGILSLFIPHYLQLIPDFPYISVRKSIMNFTMQQEHKIPPMNGFFSLNNHKPPK